MEFHECDFRTLARIAATADEESAMLGPRMLESLRGDAYIVAEGMRKEALCEKDSAQELVDLLHKAIFSRTEAVAKERLPI